MIKLVAIPCWLFAAIFVGLIDMMIHWKWKEATNSMGWYMVNYGLMAVMGMIAMVLFGVGLACLMGKGN